MPTQKQITVDVIQQHMLQRNQNFFFRRRSRLQWPRGLRKKRPCHLQVLRSVSKKKHLRACRKPSASEKSDFTQGKQKEVFSSDASVFCQSATWQLLSLFLFLTIDLIWTHIQRACALSNHLPQVMINIMPVTIMLSTSAFTVSPYSFITFNSYIIVTTSCQMSHKVHCSLCYIACAASYWNGGE